MLVTKKKIFSVFVLLFLIIFAFLFFFLLLADYDVFEEPQSNDLDDYKRVPVITREEFNEEELLLKLTMDTAENHNSERLDHIVNVCKKYGLGLYKSSKVDSNIKHPPTPQYSVFYFDRVDKLALCPIYKAGSSTWIYNMLLLGGMDEEVIKNSNKQLSDLARGLYPQLEPTDAETEFQTSKKILTVRHPFERLLSAYRDKLENINFGGEHGTLAFYRDYGSKIVKKYRPGGNKTKTTELLQEGEYQWNPSHPEPAGVEPTFREFVKYILDTDIVSRADDHWIPYYLFCTPCLLKYDFIAKVETLDQDQLYIISSMGLQNKIKPLWRHKTQFAQKDEFSEVSKVAKAYFKQLTSAEIFNLYKKYEIDFDLFDYQYKPYLKCAKDSSVNSM